MALYIIFVASLIAITILIGMRIRRLRLGDVFEHRIENRHLPEINFAAAKNTASFYGKQVGHMFVLLVLRVWIKASYFAKRKAKELEPKIKRLLMPKKIPHAENPVSQFLESVSEYKKKVKRAHAHMKKAEEAREQE